MLNVFGPLTNYEQINDIAKMFDVPERNEYRPMIGKVVKKYGYDVALYVFGQLRNERLKPKNIWSYVMYKAKERFEVNQDEENKKNFNSNLTNGNVTAMLDSLFLNGKISSEEYDRIRNVDDARKLLKEYFERDDNDS